MELSMEHVLQEPAATVTSPFPAAALWAQMDHVTPDPATELLGTILAAFAACTS